MTLYLVRHDQTALAGVCYGQFDIDAQRAYSQTALTIKSKLPTRPTNIITSPLRRCAQLATALYPSADIRHDQRLKEVNFGDWENKAWATINRADLDRWAQSPTRFQFPNGEHLREFEQRVTRAFAHYSVEENETVLFTHAGVIRLILALYTNQPWPTCLSIPVPFASTLKLKNGSYGQL